ncbi:MAG: hypothetical protein WD066_01985 [Planctomycetaceae bacterium]
MLRSCERFGRTETDFHALDYERQLRLIAYELLRLIEEAGPVPQR